MVAEQTPRTTATVDQRSTRAVVVVVLIGCALMFVILDGGLRQLGPRLGRTPAAVVAAVTMLAVALAIERVAFHRRPATALRGLGFVRATPGALLVAAVLVAVMLAFFPVFAAVTGASISLKADWLWILVGAVALNGIAEEALFRGFVFGHLRRAGRSFSAAALISLLIFAAVHLILLVDNEVAVALGGTLVAVAGAFPFALLFERAGFSIVPPVIVHVGTHLFRLFDISQPFFMATLLAWLAVQIPVLCLVFGFRNTLLRPAVSP